MLSWSKFVTLGIISTRVRSAASIAELMCVLPTRNLFLSSLRNCVIAAEINAKGIAMLVPLSMRKYKRVQLSKSLYVAEQRDETNATVTGSKCCQQFQVHAWNLHEI